MSLKKVEKNNNTHTCLLGVSRRGGGEGVNKPRIVGARLELKLSVLLQVCYYIHHFPVGKKGLCAGSEPVAQAAGVDGKSRLRQGNFPFLTVSLV